MFRHLKEYHWADRTQIIRNDHAEQRRSHASVDGKVCVITGCTSGVGWEAVRTLAAYGATIVMINRSSEKSERVCEVLSTEFGTNYGYLVADFADLSQVHNAADTLVQSYDRIHLLVNDVGMYSTTLTLTPGGVETVFCVNHLFSFILTWKLLGTMQCSVYTGLLGDHGPVSP